MTNLLSILLLCSITTEQSTAYSEKNTISKNGMEVTWKFTEDRIYFEITAPTDGWVAIGFNETSNLANTYLLMGRYIFGAAEVVEHVTLSPGNYKPLETLGIQPRVADVSGSESKKNTTIGFSIPIIPNCKYHKRLGKNAMFSLLLAYSREDDFQHHSMMRTSVDIRL